MKLTDLHLNEGQLEGLPANPRYIDARDFEQLKMRILKMPQYLRHNQLKVEEHNIILGGNMRYSAMVELGYTEAPCKVIPADATIEQLRAYTLKDNSGYGGLFCHIGIGLVGRCIGNHLALGCAYCVGLG